MGRRRKEDDLVGLIAQLGGLIMLVSLISPQVGHALSALGFLALCAFGIVVVAVILFCVYKFNRRSREPKSIRAESAWATLAVASPEPQKQILTAADLISQLRSIDWFQFEKVVALTYRKLGYEVTRRGGANPDGGIDILLEKAGQRSAVQCKQWKTWNVGVKPMREFVGALADAEIQHGIFVMLGGCTGEAKQLAGRNRIEIVNEVDLARMLEHTNARFDPETLELLHDTRKFCPKCGSPMVLRTTGKGLNFGQQFWGCSKFGTRRCRGRLPFQPHAIRTVPN